MALPWWQGLGEKDQPAAGAVVQAKASALGCTRQPIFPRDFAHSLVILLPEGIQKKRRRGNGVSGDPRELRENESHTKDKVFSQGKSEQVDGCC